MKSYLSLLARILMNGKRVTTRGLSTIELLNEKLVVPPFEVLYSEPTFRPYSKIKNYLEAELAWYLSGSPYVEDIKKYAKMWEMLAENGKANSNYGKLVFYDRLELFEGFSYFAWCKLQLELDSNSRKAVILYNRPEYFYETKDFICTQTQQFFIRDNVLSSTVYIRSSDAIRGLSFDIPWWSFVQQMLCLSLSQTYPKLKVGEICVMIGSSHLYEEHMNLAFNLIKSTNVEFYKMQLVQSPALGKTFDEYHKTLLSSDIFISRII